MADMRVIFLEDVPRVARAGEVKNVSEGYGRNYLLPKKLAVVATPGEMKRLEAWRQTLEKRRTDEARQLQDLVQRLEGATVTIKAKAAETGHLYGSVSAAEIAEALTAAAIAAVEKKWVELEAPLRQVGEHAVVVRLSPQHMASIKVIVEVEEE